MYWFNLVAPLTRFWVSSWTSPALFRSGRSRSVIEVGIFVSGFVSVTVVIMASRYSWMTSAASCCSSVHSGSSSSPLATAGVLAS
jgi:hypothetical protein